MSSNPGPSSQSTDNVFLLDTDNMARAAALPIHFDAHEAMGIGIANPSRYTDGTDSSKLTRAIAQAGVGGTVYITDSYTPLEGITFLANQTINWADNGILNRPDPVTTGISATVSNNATTATLTNINGFAVGDYISFIDKNIDTAAGTARYFHYSASTQITAINPKTNVITFSELAMGQSSTANLETYLTGASAAETTYTFPTATTIVQKVFNLITIPSGVTLSNPVINGNWKNSAGAIVTTAGAWDLYSEIVIKDSSITNVTINNPKIYNCASEAIQCISTDTAVSAVNTGGGYDLIINHPRISDIAGNAIHLSGVANVWAGGGGYIKHTNQDLSVGHVNGAFTLSFGGANLTVNGIWFDDVYTAVGRIAFTDHNGIIFTNNRVYNATYAGLDALVGIGTTDSSTTPKSLTITGNRFINSNVVQIGCAATTIGTGAVARTAFTLFNDVIFSNNQLSGTLLTLTGITNLKASNNIVRMDYFLSRQIALARAATDTTAVLDAATEVAVGRKVMIVYKGYKSVPLAIQSISGSTVTFTTAIGLLTNASGLTQTAPANTFLVDTETTPMISATSAQVTAITSGDFTIPVPDATIYSVNKFVTAGDVSGVPITPARIKAITYRANGENDTLTITSAVSATITTSARGLDIWPNGFSGSYNAAVSINGCTGNFDTCTTMGGQLGLSMAGNCTGLDIIGMNVSGFRNYGIAEGGGTTTVTATPNYERCFVQIPANGFHQWTSSPVAGAIGIWISSAAKINNSTIITTVAGQKAIYQDLGTDARITNNTCKGLASTPIQCDATAKNAHTDMNYCTVAIPSVGTGNLSGTTAPGAPSSANCILLAA